jgi:hypothetical protein
MQSPESAVSLLPSKGGCKQIAKKLRFFMDWLLRPHEPEVFA